MIKRTLICISAMLAAGLISSVIYATEATNSEKPVVSEGTEELPIMEISTTDIDGNPFTNEDFKDAKLVMINFWEPWCGPCVGEMPELEKLYENYKDQGLLIIGAYATLEMTEDAKAVVEDCKVTYPIIQVDEKLYAYESPYVPSTFFTDGEGHILVDEPMIGAMDYENWEETIKSFGLLS